ncbi:MAG: helix-turn-helix domain-containing protein [Clostridia bacterium]|nr:helix-turn-helix domain-containing protein [Clostridia bacterium]
MYTKTSTPENFQKCLTGLMAKRGLSAAQLAGMLGYKSKTTLLRVLQGKAGMRCIGNVYTDLCRCKVLQLTDAESDRLHVAYEVELWGLDDYRARLEMWRLLRKGEIQSRSMQLYGGDGDSVTLADFLNRFTPADGALPPDGIPVTGLEIYLLSGCYPSVMNVMAGMLERLEKQIHVTQVFQLGSDTARTVRLIRNILPTLGYHSYEAYYIRQDDFIPDPIYSNSGTGRVMVLRALLPDGDTREYQILLRNESSGVLLESVGLWEHWQQYMAPYRDMMHPLKAAVPVVSDYVSLLENYAETERNREILIYKGDVCFTNIPTEILVHAIMDEMGGNPLPAGQAESVLQDLNKLRSIQEKRFQNAMTKRQNTHWVAATSALYHFARTGVQKDHFFAMRPFTREERLRIFRHLAGQVKENPYFHLYLLLEEEEDTFVNLEATYLDGVGFQLTSPGTDYCLADGWTETMLTEESFCQLYREFFMEELLVHHVRPAEETAAVLNDIIRMLQEPEQE